MHGNLEIQLTLNNLKQKVFAHRQNKTTLPLLKSNGILPMRRPSNDEIVEWKERNVEKLLNVPEHQIEELERVLEDSSDTSPLLLEFVPMRLVTIIEVYVRKQITKLVDGNKAMTEKAIQLLSQNKIKIDLEFVVYSKEGKITIGDLLAHSTSINQFGNIISTFKNLIGDDFMSDLKKSHARWVEHENEWPLPPIIANYENLSKILSDLFELRHTLTHELPNELEVSPESCRQYIDETTSFLKALGWLVIAKLQGSASKTQTAINMATTAQLDEARESLKVAENALRCSELFALEKLENLEAAWKEFASEQAELVASRVEGGSMYSQVWSSEMERLVTERTRHLQKLLNSETARWQ